jgi:aspartyl protease family protein
MLFIGAAIVIAIGLVLLIVSDAGTLIGLSQDQFGRLVPLVVILLFVAAGLFSRQRYRLGEMVGNLVLWVGIFGVALVGYAYRDDLSGVASRVFGELMPGSAVVDAERGTATFRSGIDGHFTINAQINGETVRTIFDTGASAVVLSHADALKAGIATETLSYTIPVQTANGTGRAAGVVLDRVEVGGIARNRVRAFVAERGALDTSLLGMSFLSTLSRYAVSGNSLELVD